MKTKKTRRHLRTLDSSKPHPSWGGWSKFLRSCEIRDEYKGIIFYGSVNCNYIVFPDGLIITNYGFHGKSLMNEFRETGVKKTRKKIEDIHEELKQALAKIDVIG